MILQNGQPAPDVPGLYINVVPPQTNFLSPADTDVLGIVGIATWGPVNAPTNVGSLADYARKFGNPQNLKYDMGTAVWAANLQGAQNMRCVRVTDGTDTASSINFGIASTPTRVSGGSGFVVGDTVTFVNGAVITVDTVTSGAITTFHQTTNAITGQVGTLAQTATSGVGAGATFSFSYTNGVTLTAKYTGSLGNTLQVTTAPGTQNGSSKLTLFMPNVATEVFDNIGAGLTGLAFWTALAAAVNNGNAFRGPSNLAVASVGTSTVAAISLTRTMVAGTDGNTTITGTVMVGADTSPRTGMYALRGRGCSVAMLADCDTPATWPAQAAFSLSEGLEMIGVTALGDTIANAVSHKTSGGIDCYGFKLMFGDWIWFLDTINGLTRLISPQGFVAGWIAANGPQFSPLNKPLQGIVGTQMSAANTVYMTDDLVTLNEAGFDVITNPSPGGSYFSCRTGHNTSSNPAIRGDNYTRMTNFIASTMNQGLGIYVGQLQSPTEQKQAKATLDAFFHDMWLQGAIGSSDPSVIPYKTTIGTDQSLITTGKQIANCAVIFLSVIEQFIVNVEGGQTVTIPSGNPQQVAG